MNIHICSVGHSGSTLLDLLLGEQDGFVSLGETMHLPKNIALNSVCSCGAKCLKCQFWLNNIKEINARTGFDLVADPYVLDTCYPLAVDEVDLNHQTRAYRVERKLASAFVYLKLRYGIKFNNALNARFLKGARNLETIYSVAKHCSGASVSVDSSKSYLKSLQCYLAGCERNRLVTLVRDVRGYAYSAKKKGRPYKDAVTQWIGYYSRLNELIDKQVNREHSLIVRYEDIVADPQSELARIFALVGMSLATAAVPDMFSDNHILNGNRMRHSKPKLGVVDEAWRDGLTEREQDFCIHKGEGLLSSYGYLK